MNMKIAKWDHVTEIGLATEEERQAFLDDGSNYSVVPFKQK
jgi:hypothetical protein